MPRLREGRLLLDLFPEETVDAARVIWEQRDNIYGLMQARGYNGEPQSVNPLGWKNWDMEPSVFGEFVPLNEKILTERRAVGSPNDPVPVYDLVGEATTQLIVRQYDLCEAIIAALLCTSSYSVVGPTGAVLNAQSFPIPTFAAPYAWSNYSQATPLADVKNAVLYYRGHSLDFGAGKGLVLMNRQQLNYMTLNTNPADLYGRRVTGLATANNLGAINELLLQDDMPNVAVYDKFYLDANGAVKLFIPTGTAVIVGKRTTGEPIGKWCYTRNMSTEPPGRPGVYAFVSDVQEKRGRPPRTLEVHRGFNGGPKLAFPSAIIQMAA